MASDISLFCRLCAELYPKDTLIKINSGEFINLHLAEKIYQYFIINITENDILPRDICSHCLKKVLETYEFHQRIERAQGILQTKFEIKREQITESYDIKSEDDPASYDFMFDPPIMDDSEEDDAPLSKLFTTNTEEDVVEDDPLNIVNDMQTKGNKTNKIRHKQKFGETHNGEMPFKCDLCPKVYKSSSGLRKHKKGHSGIRPHECTTCGLRFSTKWTLDRHVILHSDEFNYKCSFCEKKFKKESYLKAHLRQHTGERPYSCMECNHFFTNDSNFIKHLKSRHGLVNVSIANRHHYPFPPENSI